SDHSVFLQKGVPAVLFNNWPDIAYHTNEDRPYNADPTQLKRVGFIALASLATMANAHGETALHVAELAMANAAQQTGAPLGFAMRMTAEKESLKEAVNLVKQAYLREADAIRSTAILAEDPEVSAKIQDLAESFATSGNEADLGRLQRYATALGREGEW